MCIRDRVSAEVVRRIREMPKMHKTRLIGLSDVSVGNSHAALKEAGVEAMLSKPIDPPQVLMVLGLED